MVDEKESMAMFRFGVIAPLVCRRFENKSQEREARLEILGKQWQYPDGSMQRVAERTLRLWLMRYRKHGLDGLYDGKRQVHPRKGQCQVLPAGLIDEAVRLRREVSSRSVRTIVKLLGANGFATENVNERTLARQLKQRQATKQNIERGEGYFQRWEQVYANDLWQGDTAHGVWLPDPKYPDKVKKTKLIAFLDDATRVCTHAEFYFDEQLPSLVDTLSQALQKRGRPARLLLDNAFIYHSNTLAGMCAHLQIELSFCTPRRPQGKGKIERWIRTAKSCFYPEANRAGLTSLDELNTLFQAWLTSEYHQKVHQELSMTPLARWQKDVHRIRPVDETEIRRALMLRARRRVHLSTASVTLEGEEFQVSPTFAGQTVEVRWHPEYLDNIEIWSQGNFLEIAPRIIRGAHVEKKKFDVEEEPEYQPLSSSKKYFQLMLPLAASNSTSVPRSDELLSLEEFQKLAAEILHLSLDEAEVSRLRSFFVQFAPLNKNITESALRLAADAKGLHLHLRFYLQHLEQVTQHNRRGK